MPEGANRAKPAASATSRLTIIALLCIDVLLMATHAHSATFTLPTPGRTANGEKTRRRAARMMVLPEVGALQIGERLRLRSWASVRGGSGKHLPAIRQRHFRAIGHF